MLNQKQVEQYRHDGYLFPFPALSAAELAECNEGLARYEAWLGGPVNQSDRRWRSAAYVMLPWLDRLIRHRRILDVVEDLIGPDILVYTATFFIKEADSPTFAAWHQDATYFGLDPHEHVTAWVALSEASTGGRLHGGFVLRGKAASAASRRARPRRQHQWRRSGDR
ncbi:MAG: phytanoyl-CoA dioxygenase family protein [Stellaceae bacterium]